MPVLVGLLPVIGLTFFANHTFERIASGTMIVFAAGCVWSGCRFHRRWGLFGLLGAGAALVLYLQFTGSSEENHVLNRRLRAHCHCSQCDTNRKAVAESPPQS
jgi:hypothetical protein